MHKETITIKKDLVEVINEVLSLSQAVPESGFDEVLFLFTKEIPNTDFEVDIKVVNSDSGCYVDAVLFEDGHEVMCLEPSYDSIEGQYIFDLDEESIVVEVTQEN